MVLLKGSFTILLKLANAYQAYRVRIEHAYNIIIFCVDFWHL